MLVAVHALGARGGHCDNTGFAYQRFGPETGIADGIASGADQFRDAVRFQVKYGADVIKVCATGGRPLALGRGRHAAADAGRDGCAGGRGPSSPQAGGRSCARRRRREGRDSRRDRFDRARFVPRRRGGADDEGARDVLRAHADGRRIRRGESDGPSLSAGDCHEGAGRARRPVRGVRACAEGGGEDRLRHGFSGQPARAQRAGVRPARQERDDAGSGASHDLTFAALLGLDRMVGSIEAGKGSRSRGRSWRPVEATSRPPSMCGSS